MDTGSEGPRSSGTYRPSLSGGWQEESDGEEVDSERTIKMDYRSVSKEERRYVCPIALRQLRPLMAGPIETLEEEEEEDSGFGAPEQLCRQSLSLVYSTIEESYPEGTLQLLSDLLHPRFYPPRDITCHLLRNILLDHQSPHFLCLEAYDLLMRTQSHHMADRTTLPWDWDLLSAVMFEQKCARKHRCEVVRLLWEYVLQTLEDDFRVKLSMSTLKHSIAKDTLSCEMHYSQVRDVIHWLFAAIVKSTGNVETTDENTEKDEHLRMVGILQKMLVLALEVDRSPTLSSAKLAQELFHSLLNTVMLRQHRLLLLGTLESSLLKCKLVEHLLDHACPLRTPLPMSRRLLLHFLRNCTLTPDPTDGEEGWKKWEELIQLLWMLLLSYDEVMKGHLRCSVTERANYSRPPVQTVHNVVPRSAVREAVEAFLARSQADLGQALPPHIDESLSYLQDHLMDSCPH
ncbi:SUMO-interacting motif-containing protein 1 [Aplochiton taeniatus]